MTTTINNGSKVLYLGGIDENGDDHKDIYELFDMSIGWMKLEKARMPFHIGPERSFLPIDTPNEFCPN